NGELVPISTSLKAAQFSRSETGANRNQFAIRKNIVIGKRRSPPAISGRVGNPLVQKYATRLQQVPSPAKVLRQERFTHVLKHADTDNLVVLAAGIKVAIITNFHAAT